MSETAKDGCYGFSIIKKRWEASFNVHGGSVYPFTLKISQQQLFQRCSGVCSASSCFSPSRSSPWHHPSLLKGKEQSWNASLDLLHQLPSMVGRCSVRLTWCRREVNESRAVLLVPLGTTGVQSSACKNITWIGWNASYTAEDATVISCESPHRSCEPGSAAESEDLFIPSPPLLSHAPQWIVPTVRIWSPTVSRRIWMWFRRTVEPSNAIMKMSDPGVRRCLVGSRQRTSLVPTVSRSVVNSIVSRNSRNASVHRRLRVGSVVRKLGRVTPHTRHTHTDITRSRIDDSLSSLSSSHVRRVCSEMKRRCGDYAKDVTCGEWLA